MLRGRGVGWGGKEDEIVRSMVIYKQVSLEHKETP